jgi:hypothetical protein
MAGGGLCLASCRVATGGPTPEKRWVSKELICGSQLYSETPIGTLMRTSNVRKRYRERRKRRTRERRLEKPFSQRRGALPVVLSATWLLGVALWFVVVGITQFTIDTAKGVWQASNLHEQAHEHLGWR